MLLFVNWRGSANPKRVLQWIPLVLQTILCRGIVGMQSANLLAPFLSKEERNGIMPSAEGNGNWYSFLTTILWNCMTWRMILVKPITRCWIIQRWQNKCARNFEKLVLVP